MAKSGFNSKSYFDRQAVIDAIGKAQAGVLSRQGALVRTIMKRSMRKKKGPAPAGSPPNRHEGSLAKIEFALDRITNSCVVGPAKLGKGNAPEIQDKGGKVKVRGILNRKGEFIPLRIMSAKGRAGAVASGRVIVQLRKVEARPFSQPALEKAKPILTREWKDAVK